MDEASAALAVQHGASGVAAIGAVWDAPQLAPLLAQLAMVRAAPV
jgi:thiamine monophosphate synthase